MRTHSSWTLLLVAALATSASSVFGQALAAQQPPAELPPTVFHMTTNLVLVDVVVTDKGKAVHGLDRVKFHLFEDGREQPIAGFDEHQPAATPPVLPVPPALPPHTYSNTPLFAATGVVNVLLLDGLNTPQTDQMRARQQMIDYMGKIQPGTMMAVFTMTSRLQMVTGFTTDVAQLTRAVGGQKSENPVLLAGVTAPEALDSIQDYFNENVPGAGTSALKEFEADIASQVLEQRIRMTLAALKELGLYLSAIPGRKNVIWFTGSIPAALDPTGSQAGPYRDIVGYADEVRRTDDLLAAARVAVYPVDARGLMTQLPYDSSNRGSLAISGSLAAFDTQVQDEHTAMRQIAYQTGGQAYINTNGLKEAVTSAVENGESYYTLAYTPAAKKLDGQFHKIEVKLDAPGSQLSFRRGYYADAPGKSGTSPNPKTLTPFLAASMHGAPPATQVLFVSRVLPASDSQLAGAKLPDGPGRRDDGFYQGTNPALCRGSEDRRAHPGFRADAEWHPSGGDRVRGGGL